MRRLLVPLVLLAVLASACSVKLGDQADSATTRGATVTSPIPPTKEPVAAVVNRVLPATVNVTTDIFSADQFGNPQEGQGVGTGFIVRSDGVIVTNAHAGPDYPQIFEVTRKKEVVWKFLNWDTFGDNLTANQILDEPKAIR